MNLKRIGAALALAFVGVAGCEPQSCTLIGCDFALRFAITDEDPNGFAGAETVVRVEYAGTLHTLTCDADGACEAATDSSIVEIYYTGTRIEFGLDLGQNVPDELTLEVLAAGDTVLSESISPDYEETFPNGEDCGSCTNASVSAVVPERSADSNPGE